MILAILILCVLNLGLGVLLLKDHLGRIVPTKKPEVGATLGSYEPTKGKVNTDDEVGIVEPKTAEQLDWEARQREQTYGNDNQR